MPCVAEVVNRSLKADCTNYNDRGHRLRSGSPVTNYPCATSCCCRAKPNIIRRGTSTAFFMFDSYVEPNLSNLITNQAKIAFVGGKMTGALNEELLETSY